MSVSTWLLPSALAADYSVVRALKEGPTVTSLLLEGHDGGVVVVKIARSDAVPATTLARLEREAEVLSALDSRLIAPIINVGVEDVFFLVRPFVPGVSLRELLEQGPMSTGDALRLSRAVGLALSEAHDAGIVHGDVKPENLIIDPAGPVDGAVLVDFGFSRSARLPIEARHEAACSVRYMAPEQAGLLRQEPDGRSDLYSLGVVLFECLTGGPPFMGGTLGEVFREHLTRRCPTLRSQGVPAPRVLEEVVQRLLQKEPQERYQSAQGVLADLDAIAAALDRGVAEPSVPIGGRDHRRTLGRPMFVGRTSELATLNERLDGAHRGAGGLVLLEAESGGGKTRLLDEFEHRAAQSGALVLRGGALGATPPRPLQLLSSVVGGLVQAASADPRLARALNDRLSDDRAILCRMLPDLEEVLDGSPDPTSGVGEYGEERTLRALARFLDAPGSSEQPVVVLLDDCQWADDLAVRLLSVWSRPQDQVGMHALVVAAFRSDEIPSQHPLRAHPRALHVRLGPLAAPQIRQMAESMAGPLPERAIGLINELSEGNPFLISAILPGLVESGALLEGTSGWRVDLGALSSVQASQQAGVFLAQRIGVCPPDMLRLLEVGAVLGREFDLDVAARLSEQTPEAALAVIDEARRRHLVWVRSATCAFIHDRVREGFLSRLDEGKKSELHLRVASEMERDGSRQSYDLAYHYAAAGFHDRALPHALVAAELARARHSLEIAEQQYRIAEQGAVDAEPSIQRQIAEGLGQVLMLRGRYEDAARCLGRARALSDDTLTQARVEGELSELAFKRGDITEAGRRIEEALKKLGQRVPRRRPTLVCALLKEILVQVLFTRRPRTGRGGAGRHAEVEVLTARLYSRLNYAWWWDHSTLATCWVNLRQLNAARRCLPGRELGHAYALASVLNAAIPLLPRRGETFAARAHEIHEELEDPWGRGTAESFHAVMLHALGRYREAIVRSENAVAILRRAGDPWEQTTVSWHAALCHYRLGNLDEAIRQARGIYESGLALGDMKAAAIGLEIWTKASNGQIPVPALAEQVAISEGDIWSNVTLLEARGRWQLAEGNPKEAAATFAAAVGLLDNAGMRNVYVTSVYVWLATALRHVAEQAPASNPRSRRRLVREARGTAGRALRLARLYRNDLPNALREAGMTAAMSGRGRRARRLLDRSVAVAERREARAELAESLHARGIVGLARQWPGASEDATRAEKMHRSLHEFMAAEHSVDAPTLGLAERFDALVDAGRQITSSTSLQGIYLAVRDAALTLLRAEECRVVDIDAEDVLPPAQESLPGSAIWVPIVAGGRVRAYLIATHSQISGLFGDEEERLAAFIATLAGGAMDRIRSEQETRKEVIAAQEAERGRIARDLHDAIGQALTTILLGLRLLQGSLEGELAADSPALDRLSELRSFTTEAVSEVRRLAFELRPGILDDLGLVAALERLSKDISSRHGLKIEFADESRGKHKRLASDAETAVYRIVQEALTNIIRHARATTASLLVVEHAGRLRVVVEDDGIGFDVGGTDSFGLRGMAERAGLVGGTLAITSSPSSGTSVVLEVPGD